MTFKEYFEHIKKLYEENPDKHNVEVVYSSDDEGNSYSPVYYHASLGIYKEGGLIEFMPVDDKEKHKANAICIN